MDDRRVALMGKEYDWLLVDKNDQIALFATAGYGEIPRQVLKDDVGAVSQDLSDVLVASLPPRCSHVEESHGAGTCDAWRSLSDRGLFVYDWQHWRGPYVRILRPATPVTVLKLPESALESMKLSRAPTIDFNTVETVEDEFVRKIG